MRGSPLGNCAVGAIVLLLLQTAGCAPQPLAYQAALREEGKLHLYLQPIPQEAHHLEIHITGISAIRGDGATIPLEVSFTELKGRELLGVQRRLASAALPPGPYDGLSQSGAPRCAATKGRSTFSFPTGRWSSRRSSASSGGEPAPCSCP
jgi:hypothetical protein